MEYRVLRVPYTTHGAAVEMARIYEKSTNKPAVIIGFDSAGRVTYGFSSEFGVPAVVVRNEWSELPFIISDEDAWTDDEREWVVEFFEEAIRALRHRMDIEFCPDAPHNEAQKSIVSIATKLYGPHWQSKLARAIGVNPRTLRRWVAGTAKPSGGWSALLEDVEALRRREIERRRVDLDRLMP